jgi:hypothetical protein
MVDRQCTAMHLKSITADRLNCGYIDGARPTDRKDADRP